MGEGYETRINIAETLVEEQAVNSRKFRNSVRALLDVTLVCARHTPVINCVILIYNMCRGRRPRRNPPYNANNGSFKVSLFVPDFSVLLSAIVRIILLYSRALNLSGSLLFTSRKGNDVILNLSQQDYLIMKTSLSPPSYIIRIIPTLHFTMLTFFDGC